MMGDLDHEELVPGRLLLLAEEHLGRGEGRQEGLWFRAVVRRSEILDLVFAI